MKCSDFWYNYIGHHLKYFIVKSGSLVKNDQNQQTWLKIKTAAKFSTGSIFSFGIFSEHLWLIAKSKNSYLRHVIKIMTLPALFQ